MKNCEENEFLLWWTKEAEQDTFHLFYDIIFLSSISSFFGKNRLQVYKLIKKEAEKLQLYLAYTDDNNGKPFIFPIILKKV